VKKVFIVTDGTRLLLDLMCMRLGIAHHLDRDANPIRGHEHILPVLCCSPLHKEKCCKCQRPLAKDSCSVSKGSLISELILVFNSSEGLVSYS